MQPEAVPQQQDIGTTRQNGDRQKKYFSGLIFLPTTYTTITTTSSIDK